MKLPSSVTPLTMKSTCFPAPSAADQRTGNDQSRQGQYKRSDGKGRRKRRKPDTCFVSQREYGRDFLSFADALRSALREAPDVILVGEIRDAATMRTAMMAAETGTLVLGTLHTAGASEAALRIAGMFPLAEQDTVRAQLAQVLTGIFSQRLIPAQKGGRVATMEVLLATPAVRSLIRQGKYAQLDSAMLGRGGMQTGDMDLDRLYAAGEISRETREKYHS